MVCSKLACKAVTSKLYESNTFYQNPKHLYRIWASSYFSLCIVLQINNMANQFAPIRGNIIANKNHFGNYPKSLFIKVNLFTFVRVLLGLGSPDRSKLKLRYNVPCINIVVLTVLPTALCPWVQDNINLESLQGAYWIINLNLIFSSFPTVLA